MFGQNMENDLRKQEQKQKTEAYIHILVTVI